MAVVIEDNYWLLKKKKTPTGTVSPSVCKIWLLSFYGYIWHFVEQKFYKTTNYVDSDIYLSI